MGRFVRDVWTLAREQNLRAELAQTNSTAQSYQIPVWHWASLNTECQKRGEEKEEGEAVGGGHRGSETEKHV